MIKAINQVRNIDDSIVYNARTNEETEKKNHKQNKKLKWCSGHKQ